MSKKKKAKRGFAAMTPEQRRKIASMGGKASQAKGTAHRWSEDEARQAGAKGGKASQAAGNANRFTSKTGRAAVLKLKRRRPDRKKSHR